MLPCSLAASAPGGPAGRVFHVNIRAWVCVRERWTGIRGSARGVRGARGAVAGNLVLRREGQEPVHSRRAHNGVAKRAG